jgi:hypothetical protein
MIKKLIFILLLVQTSLGFCQLNPEQASEYYKGVSHAFEFSKLKQDRPLFNIDSSNSRLEVECRQEWKCIPGGQWEEKGKFKPQVRIKMVTLGSSVVNIYNEYMGNQRKYPLKGRVIWVTAFPEIKNYCKGIKDKNLLKLSLEKFLGLPSDSTKEKVVTLWVKPDDLFRPCYSPDIHSTSCPSSFPPETSPQHINWINETIKKSYPPPEEGIPYPFTRMGFSYFWGNQQSVMGASEYVVKPDAKIYIEKVETIEEYCR